MHASFTPQMHPDVTLNLAPLPTAQAHTDSAQPWPAHLEAYRVLQSAHNYLSVLFPKWGQGRGRKPVTSGKKIRPAVMIPGTTTTVLSQPEKMPCYSYNLPAPKACPFTLTANDEFGRVAVCAGCYAKEGRYTFRNVVEAMARRFEWTRQAMRTESGRLAWTVVITASILQANGPTGYFRIHDSGDLFSPAYTASWALIARALPGVAFWAPTRSYRAAWLPAIQALAQLPNVTVRPSALHIEANPPTIAGLAAGSGVSNSAYTCPASEQGNACNDCRACWDAPTTPVIYHGHGKAARLTTSVPLSLAI